MRFARLAALATLSLGMLATPHAAGAQESGKVPRVGFLGARSRSDGATYRDAFLQGLRDLGWVETRNIAIEYRFAEGRIDRLPDLAAELVGLKVDVILASTAATAVAAKNATNTIPIVMAIGGDPVGLGLVASLARPGGNVTGLSYSVGLETFGKALELLKEAVPTARRVAVLSNPDQPAHAISMKTVKATAQLLGLELQLLEARGLNELDRAFAMMAEKHAG